MLHRMRLRQFTPQHPLLDCQMTRQEWKLDPKMGIKHDGWYARAWKCDSERPISDAEFNSAAAPKSPEFAGRSDLPAEEIWNAPRTSRQRSRELFPQTDESCDLADTYSYMENVAEMKPEQPNPTPNNQRRLKNNWRHNRSLSAITTTDIVSWAALVCSTERIRRCSKSFKNALWNWYIAIPFFLSTHLWIFPSH